jgi:prevent-host-death family protein
LPERLTREALWSYNVTMGSPYKLADAKAHFSEIVQKVMLGESVVVTKENRPVVKIVAIKPVTRAPGTGKGIWMSPDFDEPLADFAEYM